MGVLRVGVRRSVSFPIDNYIVHNRDGEVIVHTEYDGIDTDAYDESPAVWIHVSTLYRPHGLWAPTSLHIERRFRETSIGAVTPEQRIAWRAAWAEFVTRRGYEPDAQRFLSQNSFVRIEYQWSGYLHNALTLVLLTVLLAYGLMVWRCVGRVKRAAAGRCPSCGYNLCGAVSDRCPECGHTRAGMCGDVS